MQSAAAREAGAAAPLSSSEPESDAEPLEDLAESSPSPEAAAPREPARKLARIDASSAHNGSAGSTSNGDPIAAAFSATVSQLCEAANTSDDTMAKHFFVLNRFEQDAAALALITWHETTTLVRQNSCAQLQCGCAIEFSALDACLANARVNSAVCPRDPAHGRIALADWVRLVPQCPGAQSRQRDVDAAVLSAYAAAHNVRVCQQVVPPPKLGRCPCLLSTDAAPSFCGLCLDTLCRECGLSDHTPLPCNFPANWPQLIDVPEFQIAPLRGLTLPLTTTITERRCPSCETVNEKVQDFGNLARCRHCDQNYCLHCGGPFEYPTCFLHPDPRGAAAAPLVNAAAAARDDEERDVIAGYYATATAETARLAFVKAAHEAESALNAALLLPREDVLVAQLVAHRRALLHTLAASAVVAANGCTLNANEYIAARSQVLGSCQRLEEVIANKARHRGWIALDVEATSRRRLLLCFREVPHSMYDATVREWGRGGRHVVRDMSAAESQALIIEDEICRQLLAAEAREALFGGPVPWRR